MTEQVLRFANFLSSALYPTYEQIVAYISRYTGIAATLETGVDLESLTRGELAGGFICGLIYVHLSSQSLTPVELSAAPLLLGERYQQQPRYFSDIVVRQESPFTSFADLAGATWAYNESASHSGYNLVRYSLLKQEYTPEYFGTWLKSGAHAHSLTLVARGDADATAIDSHVLAALLRDDPFLAAQVKSIGVFGPSAVPPVVVSARLDAGLKRAIQAALLSMSSEAFYAEQLKHGFIERFVPVTDEHYDDIRQMYALVQAEQPLVA